MTDDLISRQALIAEIMRRGIYPPGVRHAIENAPAIDAVPVVRCKDCKRCKSDDLGNLICGLTVYEMEISKNDYCSYGERKDNDE